MEKPTASDESGSASFPEDGADPSALLNLADADLRRAKLARTQASGSSSSRSTAAEASAWSAGDCKAFSTPVRYSVQCSKTS